MRSFLGMAFLIGLLALGVYGAALNWNECRQVFSWGYCFSHEGR